MGAAGGRTFRNLNTSRGSGRQSACAARQPQQCSRKAKAGKHKRSSFGEAHVLDPDAQVARIVAVTLIALQLARAALQQRQQLRLAAAGLECILRPLYEPARRNIPPPHKPLDVQSNARSNQTARSRDRMCAPVRTSATPRADPGHCSPRSPARSACMHDAVSVRRSSQDASVAARRARRALARFLQVSGRGRYSLGLQRLQLARQAALLQRLEVFLAELPVHCERPARQAVAGAPHAASSCLFCF